MAYMTNRQQIRQTIIDTVINAVHRKDLDFKECIKYLQNKTGCSESLIEQVLRSMIPEHLKEIHILTIPDEKIPALLSQLIDEEKMKEKPLNEEEVKTILLDTKNK